MEQLNEIIAERKSCRCYLDKEISDEEIKILLESARWAPSGKNGQPWRFVVVKDKKIKSRVASYSIYESWMKNASAFIIVYLDKQKSYNYKKDIQGIGATIENISLQATYMGFGSCWIGEILDNEYYVNTILGVPDNYELMAVLCIGYAKKEEKRTGRLEVKDIVYRYL